MKCACRLLWLEEMRMSAALVNGHRGSADHLIMLTMPHERLRLLKAVKPRDVSLLRSEAMMSNTVVGFLGLLLLLASKTSAGCHFRCPYPRTCCLTTADGSEECVLCPSRARRGTFPAGKAHFVIHKRKKSSIYLVS